MKDGLDQRRPFRNSPYEGFPTRNRIHCCWTSCSPAALVPACLENETSLAQVTKDKPVPADWIAIMLLADLIFSYYVLKNPLVDRGNPKRKALKV